MTEWTSPCGRMTLRLGRWKDVLGDVEPDSIITDPPYDARTHGGHNKGILQANQRGKWPYQRREIGFDCLTDDEAREFAVEWSARCPGWICILTSHTHAPIYEAAMSERMTFPPLPVVKIGGRVRLVGDGPSTWTVWLVVARPRNRKMASWGTLPGAYITKGPIDKTGIAGGKDVGQMRPIIRDYSREGDLVCDPFAGAATTLLAAAMEGRRAIGAEMDPATFKLAVKRLSKGYTERLFREGITGKQEELL